MQKIPTIPSSEITPEQVYLSRRKFMLGVGGLALSAAVLAACGDAMPAADSGTATPAGTPEPTPDLRQEITSFESITTYNNFYEFSTDKQGVAPLAANFRTRPWTVQVGGLVAKPTTFGI